MYYSDHHTAAFGKYYQYNERKECLSTLQICHQTNTSTYYNTTIAAEVVSLIYSTAFMPAV